MGIVIMKDILCQALQYQVYTQGFKYRIESGIKQVGYEIYQHFFVHSKYPVGFGFPLGVVDNPRVVVNQVDPNFLLTVGTRFGQILEQVGDSHALDILYEGLHEVGRKT